MENIFLEIKKDFFAYRNGIIADSVRKLYPSGTKIYGLTVPQFIEISKKYKKNSTLAFRLWQDKECRESRLLALYLLPIEFLNKLMAGEMIRDVRSIEEAEFLSFKILRHLPFKEELLCIDIPESNSKSVVHCIQMLKKSFENY